MSDPRELLAVFAGGALGALARTELLERFPPPEGGWPWATFSANILGCLLLGYVVVRVQERLPLTAYLRPSIGTGFCGALTTFSTMQAELFAMIERDRYAQALVYAGASLISGLIGVAAATALTRQTQRLR